MNRIQSELMNLQLCNCRQLVEDMQTVDLINLYHYALADS